MWHLASRISASDPAGDATIHELSRATVRRLLTASSVVWLLCALLFSTQWDGLRIGSLMAGIITIGLIFGLAYSRLAHNYLVSYGLWLGGMVLAIVLASWLMENPLALLLSCVLPLVAVITLSGWAAGGTLLGLAVLLRVATLGLVGPPLSVSTAWMILAAGAFSGVFGWAARSELLSVAQWSLAGFETARGALNHAREWQLELA